MKPFVLVHVLVVASIIMYVTFYGPRWKINIFYCYANVNYKIICAPIII